MNKLSKFIALAMLGLMFILMFFSSWNDAATFDEVAHIPAGYSYLTQKDYRLNPEHPPLIKDLSAIPLLFLKLNLLINSIKIMDVLSENQIVFILKICFKTR